MSETLLTVWNIWAPLISFISIIFVWKYKLARWVLAVLILNIGAGMTLLSTVSDPAIPLALIHVIFWTPLFIYLFNQYQVQNKVPRQSYFGIWLVLFWLTMVFTVLFLDVPILIQALV